jgi:hypothetical protein
MSWSSSSYSGLHQLTKNSPKAGVLDRVAGSRSAGRADRAAVTKWSNRAGLGSKKSFCRPAPSLGREDFHASGGVPELITKCCGSERPPLLRRSGASHPPRLPDQNNKPHPETRHKSAEVLGPAAQRLRVRKPGGRIFPTALVVADTEGMRHRAGLRATSRLRQLRTFRRGSSHPLLREAPRPSEP